nr:adenosine 3'-phospho 5'-phosphosulfate transporter 2-like isoform X2 [Lepeophtheirus salmonis]
MDLSAFKSNHQFLILSSLIFIIYLTYGYIHEYIFRIPEMRDKGWSVTLFQFLYYSIFSKFDMELQGIKRRASYSIYVVLAFLTLITMGFSNASLEHLNYPTQVIFKSCKLIPVLIGGTIIQGKKYSSIDYLAALIMSIGLALFMTVDVRVNPNFNFIGVAMILTALIADAFLGNIQERTMRHFEATNSEMSFYTFSFGFLMLLISQMIFGDIPGTLQNFNANPLAIYGSIFMFSLSGYIGIQIVFCFIRSFGAFTTVVITSLRKALTVALSFMIFGKPFSMGYVYSGIILFLGIFLQLLGKKGLELSDIKSIFKKTLRK